MRRWRALGLAILVALVGACSTGPRGALPGQPAPIAAISSAIPRGQLVDRVAAHTDPHRTYALYLPASCTAEHRCPTLFILDPRGRGSEAAGVFREGAEKYGWILASSNDTSSDGPWQPNVLAMKAMLADADGQLPADPRRLYIAGFSGTARGAWALALGLAPAVAGVIVASGGAPVESPPDASLPFAVFGTTGLHDFNFREMQTLATDLDALGVAHRFETFEGDHSWPPPALATEALGWMELQAMRGGRRALDRDLANSMLARWLAEAKGLESDGKWLEALHRNEQIVRDFDRWRAVPEARDAVARLRADPRTAAALAERDRVAAWEAAERQEVERLVELLRSSSPNRLGEARGQIEPAIERWRANAIDTTRPLDAQAAARVLEHLASFLGFYLPRELRQRRDFDRATTALELALQIHDDRPALWYNLACARARAGASETALEALERALSLGFEDRDLLGSDPDLDGLRSSLRFQKLAASLSH